MTRKTARRLCNILLCLLAFVLAGVSDARAQGQGQGIVVIRDTEIESVLATWMAPLAEAAGLDPASVKLILVQNGEINAFVAGGPNIFLYTGILDRATHPGEVLGVLAHELGHISGGHLVSLRGAMENASYEMILGALIGVGAAIASGEGGAAAAITAGSRSMAERRVLAFSRVHESAADQAALVSLSRAGISPAGLVSFMEKMENQELLPASQQTEYVRTHPLTRNRLQALREGLESSPHRDTPLPADWMEQHRRIRAKLAGFITPERVERTWPEEDDSIAALYARTIAAYRLNAIPQALAGAEKLLRAEPDNPYFHEIKAQILRDSGRLAEALPAYERAVALRPDAPLIRTDLAHVTMETASGTQDLESAVAHLTQVLRQERRDPRPHRLMAVALGRLGREPLARLHLAEEALLQGRYDIAAGQARTAQEGLPENTPAWLRAQDVLNVAAQARKQQKEK